MKVDESKITNLDVCSLLWTIKSWLKDCKPGKNILLEDDLLFEDKWNRIASKIKLKKSEVLSTGNFCRQVFVIIIEHYIKRLKGDVENFPYSEEVFQNLRHNWKMWNVVSKPWILQINKLRHKLKRAEYWNSRQSVAIETK